MTYIEWIKATTARFNVSDVEAELIVTNQSALIPDPDEQVDVMKAKQALCNEFESVMPLANVTEGGYSVTWNMDAIKAYYRSLCAELGIPDKTKPKIRNASNRW